MKSRDCSCPYCDGSLPEGLCAPCSVEIAVCPECGAPLPGDAKVCAECGKELTENQED